MMIINKEEEINLDPVNLKTSVHDEQINKTILSVAFESTKQKNLRTHTFYQFVVYD